jgi:hypothetical protein
MLIDVAPALENRDARKDCSHESTQKPDHRKDGFVCRVGHTVVRDGSVFDVCEPFALLFKGSYKLSGYDMKAGKRKIMVAITLWASEIFVVSAAQKSHVAVQLFLCGVRRVAREPVKHGGGCDGAHKSGYQFGVGVQHFC